MAPVCDTHLLFSIALGLPLQPASVTYATSVLMKMDDLVPSVQHSVVVVRLLLNS